MFEKLTVIPANLRVLWIRPLARDRGDHRLLWFLDWGERAFVSALYVWMSIRIVNAWLATGNAANLLLLVSEGLVVVFVLLRRATVRVSLQPLDWLLAAGGTLLPLLVVPDTVRPLVPPAYAVLPMLAGLLLRPTRSSRSDAASASSPRTAGSCCADRIASCAIRSTPATCSATWRSC